MQITKKRLIEIIKEEIASLSETGEDQLDETGEDQLNEIGPHPDCPDPRDDRDAWRKCVDAKERAEEKRYDRWSGDMTRMEEDRSSVKRKIAQIEEKLNALKSSLG